MAGLEDWRGGVGPGIDVAGLGPDPIHPWRRICRDDPYRGLASLFKRLEPNHAMASALSDSDGGLCDQLFDTNRHRGRRSDARGAARIKPTRTRSRERRV